MEERILSSASFMLIKGSTLDSCYTEILNGVFPKKTEVFYEDKISGFERAKKAIEH